MNENKDKDLTNQLIDIIKNDGFVELLAAVAIVQIENQINEILELIGDDLIE